MIGVLKKAGRRAALGLAALLLALAGLEAFCFLALLASNYIIYGGPHELSRVRYNPESVFLREDIPRPTRYGRTSPNPTHNRLIWFFGGSTTFSDTPDDALTLPSLVARELNRSQERISFRAVNFGMPAFNSLQEAGFLRQMLDQSDQRPDLVVFYDGANEVIWFSQHRDVRAHFGFRRIKALVESQGRGVKSLLRPFNAYLQASYVKEAYDKLNQVLLPLDPGSRLVSDFGRRIQTRYRGVREMVECRGGEFLLILQPIRYVEEKGPGASGKGKSGLVSRLSGLSAMGANCRVVYGEIRKRLGDRKYFRDLSSCLSPFGGESYQADGIHLTDPGREKAARFVARAILEKTGSGDR